MNRVLLSFCMIIATLITNSSQSSAKDIRSALDRARVITNHSDLSVLDPQFVNLLGTSRSEQRLSILEMIEAWQTYKKSLDSGAVQFGPKIFLHSALSAAAALLIQQNRLSELQTLLDSGFLILVKPTSVFENDLALAGMNLIEVAIIARNPLALKMIINYAKISRQNHRLLMETNPAVAQAIYEHPSLQQVLNQTGTPFSQWTALQFRWSPSLLNAVAKLKLERSSVALAKVLATVLPFYGNSIKAEITQLGEKSNSQTSDYIDLTVDEKNESTVIYMVERSAPSLWQRVVGRRKGNQFNFDRHLKGSDILNVSADGKTRTIKILIRNSSNLVGQNLASIYQELSLVFDQDRFLSKILIKNGNSLQSPDFEKYTQSATLDSVYHSTRQIYRMLEKIDSMSDYLPLLDFKQRLYKIGE